MKNYKTIYKSYFVWDYQREIEDLNKLSEQGWQLIDGGVFSSRFKRNEDIQYRYQLDYQPKIEEKARYIESFREFGWEYVNSTFNGWHYFRKLYDPELPEEEYEIFSDRSSLNEMSNRWARLGIGLVAASAMISVIELAFMILRPTLPTLIMLISYAALVVFLIRGVVIMKNPEKSKSSKVGNVLATALLLATVGGLMTGVVLTSMRPNQESNMQADEMRAIPAELDDALLWNTIEVEYADNYYIDASIKTDSPITLTITYAEGGVVYTTTGADISEENVKVRLSRGECKIYLSNYEGGSLSAEFEIS